MATETPVEATSGGPDGVETPTESRRDRQRRELTAEIITIARRQLAEGGRAGVSWRAIAREVGMNPASLYTYFANLDDLFTAMIIESYGGLAAALRAALAPHVTERTGSDDGDDPPLTPTGEPLRAVAAAYLDWAAANPAQYNLIFTDQIPGYAAPPAGPTVQAEIEVLEPLVAAYGLVRGQRLSVADGDSAPPEALRAMIETWAMLHGSVSLSINHHLPFLDDHRRLVTDAALRSARATIDGATIDGATIDGATIDGATIDGAT